MVVILYVPRAITIVTVALGSVFAVPTVWRLVAGGLARPVWAIINLLIGGVLVYFGLRAALVRVELTPQTVTVRSRMRTTAIPVSSVRGIALLQDGGLPSLRVVRHDAADPGAAEAQRC